MSLLNLHTNYILSGVDSVVCNTTQMRAIHEITQLLFPGRCLACHKLSPIICANCLEQWEVSEFKIKYSELTVHSAILYTPVAAKIILAAKENGSAAADQLLIQAIMGQIQSKVPDFQHIRLVPIPSTKRSIRTRGRSFMVDIVQQISSQLGIPMLDCLALTGKTADQTGLNRKQRSENMKGSMSMKAVARGELIIIDDVITTGATLKEAARALNSQGFYAQISAITACVAQPLR